MAANAGERPSPTVRDMLLALLAVSVVGAGGGGFVGYRLLSLPADQSSDGAAAKPPEGDHAGGHEPAPKSVAPKPAKLEVKQLPPVVTNLARPAKSWIRLQSAIVYDAAELPHAEALVAALAGDITAFLGTLDLASLEGPDGLRRLQEELSERAATRSEGRLREFIIETLVIQ